MNSILSIRLPYQALSLVNPVKQLHEKVQRFTDSVRQHLRHHNLAREAGVWEKR